MFIISSKQGLNFGSCQTNTFLDINGLIFGWQITVNKKFLTRETFFFNTAEIKQKNQTSKRPSPSQRTTVHLITFEISKQWQVALRCSVFL